MLTANSVENSELRRLNKKDLEQVAEEVAVSRERASTEEGSNLVGSQC